MRRGQVVAKIKALIKCTFNVVAEIIRWHAKLNYFWRCAILALFWAITFFTIYKNETLGKPLVIPLALYGYAVWMSFLDDNNKDK